MRKFAPFAPFPTRSQRRLRATATATALTGLLMLSACIPNGSDNSSTTDSGNNDSWGSNLTALAALAGQFGGEGNVDGTGVNAHFNYPRAVAVDASGNLFVADSGNHLIRKVTPAGVVTTLAGSGSSGNNDGTGTAASFHNPSAIAIDAQGNLIVFDAGSTLLRKVTPAGVVTTVAGSAYQYGVVDGTGTGAQLGTVYGMAFDANGNLYFTDDYNVRKMTPAGVVTTVAGDGSYGYLDDSGTAARFGDLTALVINSDGDLLVADHGNRVVRKVTPAGVVTTYAGVQGNGTVVDGSLADARFSSPEGLALDASGNLYVSEDDVIRKITPGGTVSTVTGSAGNRGLVEGDAATARVTRPWALAAGNGKVYLLEVDQHTVRQLDGTGALSILAGGRETKGTTDGTGSAARFMQALGITTTSTGRILIADRLAFKVRQVTREGVVTTYAGTGTSGLTNGDVAQASFTSPAALAADGQGNAYVVDNSARLVRKITAAGVVSDWAARNSTNSFTSACAITADASGNLFLADNQSNAIFKVDTAGAVTALAGDPSLANDDFSAPRARAQIFGGPVVVDGTGSAAIFTQPCGITSDSAGNVYVADTGASLIRKITPAGVVTTLAGSYRQRAITDGTGTAARFNNPTSIAISPAGNLYVIDGYRLVRKITPAGVVSTVVGQFGQYGLKEGALPGALPSMVYGLAVSGDALVITTGTGVMRVAPLP
ncbi:MAG: hypothetical protein RI907_2164 [Pseudomonadota bacterium]|jgi:sugar lactone lactonase YvrE